MAFSRKDILFLCAVSAVLLVLINANYVYGLLQSNDEMRFTGLLVNPTDQMTYLSHMEQVKNGNVLLTILHTSEQIPPRIVNFFFPLMGYASLVFPKLFVYHLFRNALTIGLVFLLYYFLGYFFRHALYKRLVLIFLAFSSGWGFYTLLISSHIPRGSLTDVLVGTSYLDFLVPEAHLFYSMYLFPHFLAALLLNLLVYIFLFEYLKTGKRKTIVFATLTGFALGFVHLYEVITIYAIFTPFLLFRWWKTKDSRKYMIAFLPFYGITLIPMVYQLWMLLAHRDSYGALGTTVLTTPPLLAVLMTFGAFSVFVLYFFAVFLKRGKNIDNVFPKQLAVFSKQHREIWIFLIFWIFFNLLLLYFPLPPQRRFIQGLQIPIVILGSMALFYLLLPLLVDWMRHWWHALDSERALLVVGGVILMFHLASPLWILATDYYALANYQSQIYQPWNYYYIPEKVHEALRYVTDTNIQGTILSNNRVGLWIPTLNANRVYHGHRSQTFDREKKQLGWEQFLTQEEADEAKYVFLKKHDISYVVYVEEERERAKFKNPHYLQLIHSNGAADIYKVLDVSQEL